MHVLTCRAEPYGPARRWIFRQIEQKREDEPMQTKIRKARRLLALLVALAALLSACQPTPAEEIIVNRGDGALEEAIAATAVPAARYEAPQRWEETFEVRGQTVRIDMPVEVADAGEYPVLTVQRRNIDAQQCIAAAEALLGGPAQLREQEYGYDDILADLRFVQRGQVHWNDSTGEVQFLPYEGQQEEIDRLKALLAEAAAREETYVPLDAGTLGDSLSFRYVRGADGRAGYLTWCGGHLLFQRCREGNVQLESWLLQNGGYIGEEPHALEHVVITEEEAVAAGEAFLERLGRPDFRLARSEKARMLDSNSEYPYATLGEGYLLTYVVSAEGAIPCLYDEYSDSPLLAFLQKQEQYDRTWFQETLALFFTEEGLRVFTWDNPQALVATANENAALLPFDQVQQHVRDLLHLALPVYDEEADPHGDVLLQHMALGAALLRTPNRTDEAFLAPAWVILLTTEMDQRVGAAPCALLINALDGSYINRWA